MTNELIQDPYAKRMKDYESNMKLISRIERGQRWSELVLIAQGAAQTILELEHTIGKLKRKMHMIEEDLY